MSLLRQPVMTESLLRLSRYNHYLQTQQPSQKTTGNNNLYLQKFVSPLRKAAPPVVMEAG